MTAPKFVQLLAVRDGNGGGDWVYALDEKGRVWTMVMFRDKDDRVNMHWKLYPTVYTDLAVEAGPKKNPPRYRRAR